MTAPEASAAAAVAAVCLMAVLLLAGRRAPLRHRRGLSAVAVVTVASAGAAAALLPLPPRAAQRPAPAPSSSAPTEQDPLHRLTRPARHGAAEVFRATLTGRLRTRPPTWPLLAYQDFSDGRGWSAEPALRPAPRPRPAAGRDPVTVTLARPARLLPHPWGAVAVGGFREDPRHEALYAPSAVTRYELTAPAPVPPSRARLRAAAPVPAADRVPRCAARALDGLRKDALRAGPAAGDRLERLRDRLGSPPYRYRPSAGPGTDCAALRQLLTTHQGSGAQYATAFALTARTLGVSSRVVVGYRPRHAPAGGVVTVTGADALAWPQVRFAGLGWTDYLPLPGAAGRRTAAPDPEAGAAAHTPEPSAHPARSPSHLPLYVRLLILLGLSAMWPVLAGVLRAVRRRPRGGRRAPADQRILAAWQDVVRVAEAGRPRPVGSTARQTAQATGLAPVLALARLTERALYHVVDDDDARRAVRLAAHCRRVLRARRRRALVTAALRPGARR
ncbi:transglutaminase-like domain-containing protein [Streptomyces sp. XD-27]|uniref:transglutaminase-like domain-containing protein n=1 Tax=Streptomyces sp. XD-27 TaxID=3062779 RepID=UPI0026F468C0|nr:transglutaminase-like domain-containing protein [Streptomyces sp. XD-27]WKX73766.1 transglutaminase-like domain-containing protein [Streptomyces sp. XD-27]